MNYYIGLDAHTQTCTAVVVDERGEQKIRETFKTTEANLVKFLSRIQGTKKSLTFEECGIAQWLYATCLDHVDELIVCNPVYLAKKQGAKTDYRDALHLAQELRTNHLKPVYHDKSKWMALRSLSNNYLSLVDDIVRSKNRLKAVFRSSMVSTEGGKFYVEKLRAQEIKNSQSRFVADRLYAQIEAMEEEKVRYKTEFKTNLKRYRPIENLTSVPGIDLIRASITVAVVCQPERFKNKHQFWGYCMLVRHIQMSAGKIYGNKRVHGRKELRDIFIGAAESAIRGENSLRVHYESQRLKGAAHRDAKLSVARKIAAICLSLLKNNDTFKDDFDVQQLERAKLRKNIL